MALIAAGSIVSDIRGSIAGTTFSRNKGGLYARGRVAPINRNTPAQTAVRATFAQNAKLWSGTFTASERTLWTAFAAANPLVNILGASIIVSGLAMAQKLNQVLATLGRPPITTPPPDLSVPTMPTVLSCAADSVGDTFTLQQQAGATVADAEYYIFATPNLAAGKTPQTSQLRFVASAACAATTPFTVDFTAAWVALFGAIVAGASIGVLVATVDTQTGAVTPGVRFNIVAT